MLLAHYRFRVEMRSEKPTRPPHSVKERPTSCPETEDILRWPRAAGTMESFLKHEAGERFINFKDDRAEAELNSRPCR